MRLANFSSAALVLPVSTSAWAGGGQYPADAGADAVSSRTRLGAAVAVLAVLLVGVVLLGCTDAPIGRAQAQIGVRPAADAKVRVSQAPAHIFASEGDNDYREPLKYMGQAAVQ
jgi:hypothetical protein